MKNYFRIAENLIFKQKKLHAISYLEIVISLIIITAIVFLTTPFLSHTDKKPKDSFGTFACFSVYDYKTNSWKLHEISRYNSDYDTNENKLSREDVLDECKFIKPADVDRFDISIIGGGGGGSSAVRIDCDKTNKLHKTNCYLKDKDGFKLFTSLGQHGKNGQIISKSNVLLKDVFEKEEKTSRDVLRLRLCPDGDYKTSNPAVSGEACIGAGGEGGVGISYSSYYNVIDVISDIVTRYNSTNYLSDDTSNLSMDYMINTINAINPQSAKKLKDFYDSYDEKRNKFDKIKFDIAYNELTALSKDVLKDTFASAESEGRRGTSTRFFYNIDNRIEKIIAAGGEGGFSSSDKPDAKDIKKSAVYFSGSMNNEKAENIPAEIMSVLKPENDFLSANVDCNEANPSCNGNDAKYYIGAGGDGGGIMYNFGSKSRDTDISFRDYLKSGLTPYFKAGHGGRGGGGAVIIRW